MELKKFKKKIDEVEAMLFKKKINFADLVDYLDIENPQEHDRVGLLEMAADQIDEEGL